MSEETIDEHTYVCYDVVADDDLVDEVARLVLEMYVDPDVLLASLAEAAADLESVVSDAELTALVAEVRASVIPQVDLDAKQVHLQTPRNEVAEILAYDALQQIHKAIIPAARVREKEVPGLPTRGLDIFALLMEPKVRAVICEVKASSALASPPPVVHSGPESMHAQILNRLGDRTKLIEELTWALKHAVETARKDVAMAMIMLARKDAEPPIAAPVLVRPEERHGEHDYGKFKVDPTQYHPAQVRFLILRIQGTLEEFASRVYARAREVV